MWKHKDPITGNFHSLRDKQSNLPGSAPLCSFYGPYFCYKIRTFADNDIIILPPQRAKGWCLSFHIVVCHARNRLGCYGKFFNLVGYLDLEKLSRIKELISAFSLAIIVFKFDFGKQILKKVFQAQKLYNLVFSDRLFNFLMF